MIILPIYNCRVPDETEMRRHMALEMQELSLEYSAKVEKEKKIRERINKEKMGRARESKEGVMKSIKLTRGVIFCTSIRNQFLFPE